MQISQICGSQPGLSVPARNTASFKGTEACAVYVPRLGLRRWADRGHLGSPIRPSVLAI